MSVENHKVQRDGRGACANCHRVRKIVDIEHYLCRECYEAYKAEQEKNSTLLSKDNNVEKTDPVPDPDPEEENALIKFKKMYDQKQEQKQQQQLPENSADPVPDADHVVLRVNVPDAEPVPAADADPEPDPDDNNYYCSICGALIPEGADQCPKCGVICDWRGTELETDQQNGWLICPKCGAARHENSCNRCGYGYESR